MIAIYPGSFDPVTNGHIDIIKRCASTFDYVIVAVLINQNKNVMFSAEERIKMIQKSFIGYDNVKVESFDGLLVEYARSKNAQIIIRGLRAISDYEYEMQMSLFNYQLAPEIETLFLVARGPFSYLSSSIVKEVASYGGDISSFVPSHVENNIIKNIQKRRV